MPHGIIGQSFASASPRHGRVDLYPPSGRFKTQAMAEGAIEGQAANYEVATPFATHFAFSCFDTPPREPTLCPEVPLSTTPPAPRLDASAFDGGAERASRRLSEAAGAPCAPPSAPPPSTSPSVVYSGGDESLLLAAKEVSRYFYLRTGERMPVSSLGSRRRLSALPAGDVVLVALESFHKHPETEKQSQSISLVILFIFLLT